MNIETNTTKRPAPKTKLSLDVAKSLAKLKNGECLSTEYINSKTPLKWKCVNSHYWNATISDIKRGGWCKMCVAKEIGNRNRLNIDVAKNLAVEKGGECLSTEYIDNSTHLLWKCKIGHTWRSAYSKIKSGRWCPHCFGRYKYNINEMKKIAQEREGECLSTEYKNVMISLIWKCKFGHEFSACPYTVIRGQWCPECNLKAIPEQIELEQHAINKGGKCLSNYTHSKSKVLWECARGHTWNARWDSIKAGSWCPYCVFKTENYCRDLLEYIIGFKFLKVRPDWLRNEEGKTLEIDGYCEEMQLAFEYNGSQHYKFEPHFHVTVDKFHKQLRHDKIKMDKCAENNTDLIIIPCMLKTKEKINNFVLEELIKLGYPYDEEYLEGFSSIW